MVTGPGNVYLTAAKRAAPRADRHRLRGGHHRDRHPRRRHRRPRARRRRPHLPGRARPERGVGAGHDVRGAGRRGGRRARAPGAGDQAHRAHPHGAHRPAVRDRARRATSTTGSRSSTPTPPSTWRSRPATRPHVAAAGPQRGRDVRRPVVAGVARRLLRRLQPRAAHRRLRPALRRAVGADVPARRPRRSTTPRRRCARWPTRCSRSPPPRTCPRTARRSPRDSAVPAGELTRRGGGVCTATHRSRRRRPSPSTSSRSATTCAARPPTAPRSSTSRSR